MSFYQNLYFFLLFLSFIISLWKLRGTSLNVFPFLLGISILTEILYNISYEKLNNNKIENLIYQIYIPIEFTLFSLFFRENTSNLNAKTLILLSIPLFYFIDLLIGLFFSFTVYPGHIANFEGLLISIMSANILLNLKFQIDLPIYRIPLLWIGTGLLLYYSSSFIYNGLYNYLFINKPYIHNALYNIMMKFPNYILYIFLSIGFLCPQQTKI